MSEVERNTTPLSDLEVAQALRAAYVSLFGEDPTHEILGVGWAQIALENAHGRAIHNYNFGNITGQGEGGDFYLLTTPEQVSPGTWQEMTMRYAAHPTPEAGALAYWRLITGPRYRPAFDEFFTTGNAEHAALKLHDLGYFTANAGPISLSFAKLYEQFTNVIAPSLGGLGHGPKDGCES